MVLVRVLALALVLAGAGCGESLFDANGPGGGGGGDDTPDSNTGSSLCPATCLADAAADFDGSLGGMGDRWRYLDDQRNRTWAAMAASGGDMIGADPANKISTCAAKSGAAACAALPGALLVSTAGATSTADPALAFTAGTAQIIQLTVRVHVPSGGEHRVRVYRNSREDVLFTGSAMAGATLEQAVTLDALANDRFYVALAPTAMGAVDIGVHFYVNATGAAFPAKCQVASTFAMATGNTIDNLCGTDFTSQDYNSGPVAPALAPGPFAELGMAADIAPDRYYDALNPLDHTGDTTVQLWIKLDAPAPNLPAWWAFSDLDLDFGGGLGLYVRDNNGQKLGVEHCTSGNPLMFDGRQVPYPTDGAWRFIRAVHTNGMVSLCVDGVRMTSFPVAAGKLVSTHRPHLGKNVVWTPSGAFWDGRIDDVRVFSTALPCD